MALESYASESSVRQGGTIDFHVSDRVASEVAIRIFQVGAAQRLPILEVSVQAKRYPVPERAFEFGCGWPPLYSLKVPHEWPSGLYRAKLTNSETPSATSEIFFVVKPDEPGVSTKTLFQLSTATYQAYNDWGGKSLYPSDSSLRARRVSFHRPGGMDYTREIAFLLWAKRNAFPLEFCAGIDLHIDPFLLSHYQLMISVGHDEYWSKEMRDQVERFIEGGGNVAFFSGNVCWWQVRFEDANRTMVCYRSAPEDPLAGVDNSRVTVNWHCAPVNRPENHMTGVSFRNGAGIWRPCSSSMSQKAFKVCQPHHWVFQGTGLTKGDLFGVRENIVGYETDSADYSVDEQGDIRLTGRDGTPPSFVVLATADLSDWGPCGQAGRASMGVFRRCGTVFTAATTDWVNGLVRPNSVVQVITKNVLDRLSRP